MEVASLLHTAWFIRDETSLFIYKPSLINQTACIKLFLSARGRKVQLKNKKVGEKAKMNVQVGNIIILNVFLICCYAQTNTENTIFTTVHSLSLSKREAHVDILIQV